MALVSRTTFDLEVKDLPAIWAVRRIVLRERLSNLYYLSVDASLPEDDLKDGDVRTLLKQNIALSMIQDPDADDDEGEPRVRDINGIIRAVVDKHVAKNADGTMYRSVILDIVPAVWLLTQTSKVRQFERAPSPEIVRDVLKDALTDIRTDPIDIDKLCDRDYPKVEWTPQTGATDYQFITRLLQRDGISFYFDHSGDEEKMILIDQNDKYAEGPKLNYHHDPASLTRFHKVARIRPAKHTVQTRDANARESAELDEQGDEDATTFGTRHHSLIDPGMSDGENITEQAKIRDQSARTMAGIGFGASKYVGVGPGHLVEVTTDEFDDKKHLIVASVSVGVAPNTLALEGNYHSTGASRSELETSFEFVDPEEVHVRPPPLFPIPPRLEPIPPQLFPIPPRLEPIPPDLEPIPPALFPIPPALEPIPPDLFPIPPELEPLPPLGTINGFAYARVIDVATGKEDVSTDGDEIEGRGLVKLSFDWDPEGRESRWIPVAMPWAGQGIGTWFLPRVGMIVVVVFEYGDPTCPIVVGCVHDTIMKPPFGLPIHKTKSGIVTGVSGKSKEESGRTEGANQLVFEDSAQSEEIFVRAQKNMNFVAQHNQTVIVGEDWAGEYWGTSKEKTEKDNHPLNLLKEPGNRTVLVGKGWRDWMGKTPDEFKDKHKAREEAEAEKLKASGYCLGKSIDGIVGLDAHYHRWKGAYDGEGEEGEENSSEIKVVMGNQRNEVHKHRSHIVHGNETIEIAGDRHTTVGGTNYSTGGGWDISTNINGFGSAESALLGGGAINVELRSTLIDLLVGNAWEFIAGTQISVMTGLNISAAPDEFEVTFGLPKFKKDAKSEGKARVSSAEVVEVAEKVRAVVCEDDYVVRSKKAVRLQGGADLSLVEKLVKKTKDIRKDLLEAGSVGDFAEVSLKSMVSLASTLDAVGWSAKLLKGIKDITGVGSEVKKITDKMTKPAEDDVGELRLAGNEVELHVGKNQFHIKEGTITIKNEKTTIEIKDSGATTITVGGALTIEADKVDITGDTKIDGKLDVTGKLTADGKVVNGSAEAT